MGKLILVSGPNGSGKSRFAEELIRKTEGERFYVATMKPCTAENFSRIRAHREIRKDLQFQTLELPSDIEAAPVTPQSVVLLEDISNLLANLCFDRKSDEKEAFREITALQDRCALLVAVTISGLKAACASPGCGPESAAPMDEETKRYVDRLNRLNRMLSVRADACAEMRDGTAVWTKGNPKAAGQETAGQETASQETADQETAGANTADSETADPGEAALKREAPEHIALKLADLSVGYGGKTVLGGLNLGIRRGEVISLIGPNGAGKSTVLKTVIRQLKKISGSVVLVGKDLDAYGDLELAQTLSVVLTRQVHPERMTCRDVVSLGRDPYSGRLGILGREDRRKVDEALTLLDLTEIADRDFEAVSDGQRQRVLIARALCQDPDVLVLDEPTSYLDIRYKLSVLSLLRHLSRTKGLTVLMSLHEIDLALKCSDRLVFVTDRGTVYTGRPNERSEEAGIRSLFHIEEGSFDPLFGSAEFPGIPGQPRIFVFSAGGTGIPVYRTLQRAGVPFAAGILWENDADFRVAHQLAAEVISEKAFEPISDETFQRALKVLECCDAAVDAGFPRGSLNARLLRLRDIAEESGKLADSVSQALGSLKGSAQE